MMVIIMIIIMTMVLIIIIIMIMIIIKIRQYCVTVGGDIQIWEWHGLIIRRLMIW